MGDKHRETFRFGTSAPAVSGEIEELKQSVRSPLASFRWAFRGIRYTCRTQRNFRIQLGAAAAAAVTGITLEIAPWEWALLCFAITGVLVAEAFNTAIEYVIDLVEEKRHFKAMFAKDIAAGAVLISAVNAVLIAAVVFLM
jgi:diacylglycerol kinase (ATP)